MCIVCMHAHMATTKTTIASYCDKFYNTFNGMISSLDYSYVSI